MKEAMFYEKLDNRYVKCSLCAHRCKIGEGKRGLCSVRENRNGTLYTLVYGFPCSINSDPIEKKPLFHFLPGSRSFSVATVGCNLFCLHCQNAGISQYPAQHGGEIAGMKVSPSELVESAILEECRSISYTYTEPSIYLEYALDCARSARERGLKNVFVSNGYMTPESAEAITPYLDGNNIDLKGDDTFYKSICKARSGPVKDTIRFMRDRGVWVEITTLVITGLNDSEQLLREIAEFITSVDEAIPWHVTQFHPTHKLTDRLRTPLATLKNAVRIGYETGLKYVYEGNVPGEGGENTICPHCKKVVIERFGFSVLKNYITDSTCRFCGASIEGVW